MIYATIAYKGINAPEVANVLLNLFKNAYDIEKERRERIEQRSYHGRYQRTEFSAGRKNTKTRYTK